MAPISIDGSNVRNLSIDGEPMWEVTIDGEMVWTQYEGVEAGVIAFYDGSSSNIPNGWLICDGNNGTPDLIDRYIHMVGPGEDPGATGGSSAPSSSGHDHSLNPSSVDAKDKNDYISSGGMNSSASSTGSHSTTLGSEHRHQKLVPIQSTGVDSFMDSNIVLGSDGSTTGEWSTSNYNDALIKGDTSPDSGVSGSGSYEDRHDHSFSYTLLAQSSGSVTHSTNSGTRNADSNFSNTPAYITLNTVVSNKDKNEFRDLIAFWNDTLGTIPEGWLFCDGNNGTPNLAQDRMLRGDSTTGNTGGSNTQSGGSHNHSISDSSHASGTQAVGIDSSTGSTADSISDIRKPYHKLAPIQRT